MIIYLTKAKDGDCFVIDFENGKCILIDGGYNITFDYYLKPLLLELHEQRKKLEYVISTHYDQDHISGLLEFFYHNGIRGNERIIPVENVITNGYGSFSAKDVQKLIRDSERPYKDGIHQISAVQQSELNDICKKNHYPINACTNGEFITNGTIISGTGYTIRILNPTEKSLEKLKKDLTEHIMIPAESIESQDETHKISGAFYSDIAQWKNVKKGSRLNHINKASIVCEIEFEGKRFLFCGDSEMNDIRDSLQSHYDVIKLSHHGTYYGNRCFIGEKAVTADKYIISTNAIREKREHP